MGYAGSIATLRRYVHALRPEQGRMKKLTVRFETPPGKLSRFRKFGQRDKWRGCSPTAIKMAEKRSNDDAPPAPEPHSGI